MSTFDTAKANPGRRFYSSDFSDEADRETVSELGGFIRWCEPCGVYDAPNSPCWCGVGIYLVRDANTGLYWSSEGWAPCWRFDAEHYLTEDEAQAMAETVANVTKRKE